MRGVRPACAGGVRSGRIAGVIGLVGRVTGRIGAGLVGEVMVSVPERPGSEAFLAYRAVPGDPLEPGSMVVVVDYQPPRTVYVEPF